MRIFFLFALVFALFSFANAQALPQCGDYHGNTGNVPISFFGIDDTFLPKVNTAAANLNATLDTMPCAPHFVVQDAVDAGEMTCPDLDSWLSSIPIGNTVNDGIYICTMDHGFDGIDGCPLCASTTPNISSDATTGAPLNSWTDVALHRSLIKFEWNATTQAYPQATWDALFAHEFTHAIGGAGDANPRLSSYPSAVWGFSAFYDKWDIWWFERRFGDGPLVGWTPGTFTDPTVVPTRTPTPIHVTPTPCPRGGHCDSHG
jgi:hypothetical protein